METCLATHRRLIPPIEAHAPRALCLRPLVMVYFCPKAKHPARDSWLSRAGCFYLSVVRAVEVGMGREGSRPRLGLPILTPAVPLPLHHLSLGRVRLVTLPEPLTCEGIGQVLLVDKVLWIVVSIAIADSIAEVLH